MPNMAYTSPVRCEISNTRFIYYPYSPNPAVLPVFVNISAFAQPAANITASFLNPLASLVYDLPHWFMSYDKLL
jgi:hypothetical protein